MPILTDPDTAAISDRKAENRMRLRNIPGADAAVAESRYCVASPASHQGRWQESFPAAGPLHIEIGMGKGRFLMALAALHPERNYLGVERYSSVLLRALQKMEQNPLPNLKFLCIDAAELPQIFAPGEISRIYLNFSDPWPKERHAKRRLVSREFLDRYRVLLAPGEHLEFKTDNKDLFDFGVEETEPARWEIKEITYDLHHDEKMNQGNIMTEYEERFSSRGNPIYKYIIKPCNQP